MPSRFDPDIIRKALISPRWAGQVRLDASPAAIARWDKTLVRDTRVLVPIDVQALYVPAGDTTPYVRLPFALTTPDGQPPETMPDPFDKGKPRTPGVYLHWMPPDHLLKGALTNVDDGSRNRLGMPALPDRWVVIRIAAPIGGATVLVKGWVIEADTAKVIPLENWPAGSAAAVPEGRTVAREDLTGTVGGHVNWVAGYDGVKNRLAFYDPLTDLPTAAPQGVTDDLATYVVAGWWSDPTLDPLDGADTASSLHVRLHEIGHRLVTDAEGADQALQDRKLQAARRDTLGLASGSRYGTSIALKAASPVQDALLTAKAYSPLASKLAENAAAVVAAEPRQPRLSLLHGSVHGVPVRGPVIADLRPDPSGIDLALGRHMDDLAAVLAAVNLPDGAAPANRRALERLLSAFTGQVLSKLSTPDGAVAADEHEHEAGFASRSGGQGAVERLRTGAEDGPLNAGRAARGEQSRLRNAGKIDLDAKMTRMRARRKDLLKGTVEDQRAAMELFTGTTGQAAPKTDVREVRRPAPRYFLPHDPMLAIRGIKRSLRLQNNGRFSPDKRLQVRYASQASGQGKGLADGADYIPSLPSGAIPDEVLKLARAAAMQDPYMSQWLADLEARRRNLDRGLVRQRLAAEAAIRFGPQGVYDGGTSVLSGPGASVQTRRDVADQLRRFSLFPGVDPDPVAVTNWAQPWIPLWIEWEVELSTRATLEAWRLAQVDMESDVPTGLDTNTLRGRSPLHAGTARTLAAAIEEWLTAENERDRHNQGEVDDSTAQALQRIADGIGYLDILSASLEGLHDRLLGLPVDAFGLLHQRAPDGAIIKPAPAGLPQLLLTGVLKLTRARVIDGFGRILDLPVDTLRLPARDETDGALALRPRILRPARWMFRLIDPVLPDITGGDEPAEAGIDQIDPSQAVNPVSGFILPDHMDEALEVFDAAGTPLGQLMHEPFGGGVVWEIAPGRTGPADAGPGLDLAPRQQILGLFAAGMVVADARERNGRPARPESESALSAFLRAIDTTLWTVDTFAHFGSEHIAGLVGRPIAVVRATLRLEIQDDLNQLTFASDDQRAARAQAYKDLADRAFPVRLGELTRSDDGLLGFFVDDDYSQFHVVDKVVRDSAFDARRGRGQLAQYGTTLQVPDIKPITHPYVFAEDEIRVRPGQVVRLTLLMHPAGRVHLTSGILPRKSLQLVRDWVHPGLSVMAPSVRVGPVLVDPEKIRLPKVSSFPKDQVWTRRTTPSTWKDDPILAATQEALFPEMPSDIQEGYIRVAPNPGVGSGA